MRLRRGGLGFHGGVEGGVEVNREWLSDECRPKVCVLELQCVTHE